VRKTTFYDKAKKFLAVFALVFFIPYVLATYVLDVSSLNETVAGAEAGVLSGFGFNAWNRGELVFFNGGTFRIVAECTGAVMSLLFIALIASTGISRKNAALSIALGVPFLVAFNLLRLAVTFTAGSYFGSVEALHSAFWFLDGGVVLLAWLAAFRHDAALEYDKIK
jgi:exosortase/archaeosortase family protein